MHAAALYSGHGMQLEGSNWMLPVDARNIGDKADMTAPANSMNVVIDQLIARADTSVILLDACRDNPFVEQLARSAVSRIGTKNVFSRRKGLARIDVLTGDAYVAFATAPEKLPMMEKVRTARSLRHF